MLQAVAGRGAADVGGTILQEAALHVAHQGQATAAAALDLGDIHHGRGIGRLVAGGALGDPVVEDSHDAAIGVNEGNRAAGADAVRLLGPVGQDELAQVGGGDEGAAVAGDAVDQQDEVGARIGQAVDAVKGAVANGAGEALGSTTR